MITQDLCKHDYDPRELPSGLLDRGHKQVVIQALLSRDAGLQIDIADHQVTLLGLVQSCTCCASPSWWSDVTLM